MLIEGFGASATGGAGGSDYLVTSLADDGSPGTLRWALAQAGPRIITFGVAGVIELADRLAVPHNTTLAGNTAPGAGVALKGSLDVHNNCILRYLRIRPGAGASGDALQIVGRNVAVDHCSLSWGNDENIGIKRLEEFADRNITIQWCIISEAEKGVLAWHANRTSMHHNLLAHNYTRNPVFAGEGYPHVLDFRNNVIYDAGEFALALKGSVSANVIGNYFALGNLSREHVYSVLLEDSPTLADTRLHMAGNSGPRTRRGADGWSEVRLGWNVAPQSHRVAEPFAAPPVTSTSAEAAYEAVLASAGASLPVRDAYDARIVQDVREGLARGSYPRGPAATRRLAAEQWAALDYPATEAVEEPPVVEPPAEEPPVQEPPAAEEPPAEEPAARTYRVRIEGDLIITVERDE